MKVRWLNSLVVTESEYRANHAGLNTFFGAVLGFVMAGTEQLEALEFAYILLLVSGIVISILYVSASKQRLVYAALTLLLIAFLPRLVGTVIDPGESLPDKLQPTLFVWTLLSVFVEYFPRRPDDPPAIEP